MLRFLTTVLLSASIVIPAVSAASAATWWSAQLSDWAGPTPLVYYNGTTATAQCGNATSSLGIFVGREDGVFDGLQLSHCAIPTTKSTSGSSLPFTAWARSTGDDITASAAISLPQSLLSTANVSGAGEVVAFGSLDGKLYGAWASTGTSAWIFDTGRFIKSSPIYYAAINCFIFGGTSTFTIYSVNAYSGALVWQHRNSQGGKFNGKAAIISTSETTVDIPADLLVIGSADGFLYFLNAASGTVQPRAGGADNYLSLGCSISTQPVLTPDRAQIVVACSRDLIAVSLQDRSFRTILTTGGVIASSPLSIYPPTATHSNLVVLAGSDGHVYGVDCTASGQGIAYTITTQGSTQGDSIFLPQENLVLFTRTSGSLWAMNPDTGYVEGKWVPAATNPKFHGGPATYACGSEAKSDAKHRCTAVAVTLQGGVYGVDVATLVDGSTSGDYSKATTASQALGADAIAGVAVGCTVFAAILIGVIAFLAYRHYENEKEAEREQAERRQAAEREQEERRQAALRRDGQRDEGADPYGAAFQAVLNVPADRQVVRDPYHADVELRPITVNPVDHQRPPEPVRQPRTPVITGEHADSDLEDRLFAATQTLSNAVLNTLPGGDGGGAAAELPWWYIERLTKDFSEPLPVWSHPGSSGHKGGASASMAGGRQLFLGSEFIEGVLTRVVVKVFQAEQDGPANATASLPHEMKIASNLRHRNIIPIYAFSKGTDSGRAYATVMRHISGGSLAAMLCDPKASKCLPALSRLHVALGVAHGLKEMHSKGLYHRDVKSNNVLVDTVEGEGILIDFDVSCETAAGSAGGVPAPMAITQRRRVFGTPGYICPDYARLLCGYGEPQEVYSFCMVLAELLTGKLSAPADGVDFAESGHKLSPAASLASEGGGFTPIVAVELRDIIRRGLDPHHRKRPALGKIIKTLKGCIIELRHPEESMPGSLSGREWSSLSVGDDVGPAPQIRTKVAGAGADTDFQLFCCICAIETSEFGTKKGVECSANDRHFLCDECINNRVATLLDSGEPIDLMSLPCSLPGCRGRVFLSNFATLLHPKTFRRWHEAAAKAAHRQGQEEAQEQYTDLLKKQQQQGGGGAGMRDFQKHLDALRKVLQPACPHCKLPFVSFSGCLAVTCGVRGVQGCNKRFCGACLVAYPCPAGHGHGAMTHEQLHHSWMRWRRKNVLRYLEKSLQLPRDAVLRASLVEALRVELEACGIYPLDPRADDVDL